MKPFAILLFLLTLARAQEPATPLLDTLPEDTLAVFTLRDLPALEARRAATPLHHLRLLDTLESPLPEFNRFKDAYRQFHAQLAGELVLSVSGLEPYLALLSEHREKRLTLWNDVDWSDDTTSMDSILAAQEEMTRLETEALRATLTLQARIHDPEAVTALLTPLTETLPALQWDLRDHLLTLSFSETGLQTALAHRETPPAATLTASEDFTQAAAALGEHDTLLYINLPRIASQLFTLIPAPPADAPETALTPARLRERLDPEGLLPAAFAARLTPDALHFLSHYGFRRESILSRLLLDSTPDPAPTPTFVHRDADQVHTLHWNSSSFLQTLQQDLATLSPELGIGIGFIKMAAAVQLGIDPDTQLLQTLGTGITLITETDHTLVNRLAALNPSEDAAEMLALSQEHPTGGVHYLLALEVKDLPRLQQSLDTLVATLSGAPMPAPLTRDGLDITYPLTNMAEVPEPFRPLVAHTFLDNHLLIAIGNPDLLQRAALAHSDPAQRLWTHPGYLATRARLPEPASVLNYTSGAQIDNSLRQLETGATWLSALSDNTLTYTGTLPETPLIQNSLGVTTRDGLRVRTETLLPFPAE